MFFNSEAGVGKWQVLVEAFDFHVYFLVLAAAYAQIFLLHNWGQCHVGRRRINK